MNKLINFAILLDTNHQNFSIPMKYKYDIKWQVHMYEKISWKLNDVQNMGKFDTAWSLLGNMSRLF